MRRLWIVSSYSHTPENYIEGHALRFTFWVPFYFFFFILYYHNLSSSLLRLHASSQQNVGAKDAKKKIKLFQFCKTSGLGKRETRF